MHKTMKQDSFNYHTSSNKHAKGLFLITGFNKKSSAFLIGLLRNSEVITVGEFYEGIKEEEAEILKSLILKNKTEQVKHYIYMEPSICVELQFKEMKDGKIINPYFLSFRTDKAWDECTAGNLYISNEQLHREVTLTSKDKPIWQTPFVSKDEYIVYLFHVADFMLPFLKNRTLTTIRFPHGVGSDVFYQKNRPSYAPSFIQTHKEEEIDYIVCNDLSTFIWLGNQLALEFHIPFHEINNKKPREIVFDLDPPSKEDFHLAVKAAKEMKLLFDKFQLITFPKLSGNKGLQIHLPLKNTPFTYKEARVFTSFIANYLVEKFPNDFSVERMKKKRGNRLYIDYVQHWHGKTIICPYSTRGRDGATVAVPLFWEEIDEALNPANYTIFHVMKRVKKQGCPFQHYFQTKNEELIPIIHSLQKNYG